MLFTDTLDKLHDCSNIDLALMKECKNDEYMEQLCKKSIKICDDYDELSLINIFKKHKIYNVENMVIGYYLNNYPPKLTMDQILYSLHKLYINGESAHYIYILLCIYMFNYLALDEFIKEFAKTDFLEVPIDIIKELQDRYSLTSDNKYLYMVAMILRGNKSGGDNLKKYLRSLYIDDITYDDITYDAESTKLGKITKLFSKKYLVGYTMNNEDRKDILLEQANLLITFYMRDVEPIYKAIFYHYDMDKQEIDMDKLHNMLIHRKVSQFGKDILYILHWAHLAVLAQNNADNINGSKPNN